MRTHTPFIIAITIWLAGWSILPAQQLECRLVIPQSNPQGQRELDMSRYKSFHVVLRNISSVPVKIWKDWNSWGYYNLSLSFSNSDTSFTISKKSPTNWDGDFADYWTVPAGESLVLDIDMRAGVWKGLPDLYGETMTGKIKATYENKPDALAAEFGIWTGKLTTASLPVIFK